MKGDAMAIRLYFPIFNANQLFSPIIGEYRNTKERLKSLGGIITPQLKGVPRLSSKRLPTPITITFIINKNHYEPNAFLLLSHKILEILCTNVIIQDINESCISKITIKYKTTYDFIHEGCLIEFTD